MKIKKVVLNNFFRYYGRQEILFSVDDDKNVTILRGENGTGKTTLLNAFYWGFYGDVIFPLTIDNMLNYRKSKELKEGELAEALVEIEFEDKNVLYTIIRKQNFIKKNGQLIKTGQPYLNITYTNDKGNETKIEYAERFFEDIIPKQLRGFFFFDGERINRLAQIDGKEEIKKAILDILGLTVLDLINNDLEKLNQELSREKNKYLNKDEEEINNLYLSKLDEKEKLNKDLEDLKQNENQIKENLKQIDVFLQQHNSDVIKNKQNERKTLETEVKKHEESLESNKKNLINLISKEFKLYIISNYVNKIESLLEEKRKKGELPSDIKKQFVKDLLERKRCICGRPLIEGSEEYDIVYNLMKVAGQTELDSAYIKLTAFINEIKEKKANNEFYNKFYKLIEEEMNLKELIEQKKNKIKNISEELKKSPEEQIKTYENLREKYLSVLSEINRKIGQIQLMLEDTEKEIKKLDNKLKEIKLESKQARKIERQREVVQKIGQLNKEIQELFILTTRQNLDKKIKEVFAQMTRKDYRKPILTENFELKIVSELKNNNESEVLSTGEGQVASLAFIGALISYSKEKMNSSIISDFAGGDFPIVMDSPFGYLDYVHTANVAANIGKLASQVIIIVSDKQWSKEVEENIIDQVGKMYKMIDEVSKDQSEGEYTIIREMKI
ncbi:MAG: uncharacterized protein JG776_398 [Caloramator sp.]|jgi:DNA sulfur modification protein DndD|uniref:AAA family ATPase n=1 Tax=Caloramator sp. TaxID=1871330 RepID=UPI001D6D187A|nr:AAA family ATPase [Caloramator sp.]MBZ4662716.1 uncharacterized protein [Caloramator sp.]